MLAVPGVDAAVMDDIRGRLGEYAEMDDFEKEAALPELRRYLALSPDVCAIFGDVALRAKETLAKLAGHDNPMLTESAMLRVAALEAELAQEDACPAERLAAQNVAVCWLAVYEAEITAAKTGARKKMHAKAEHCDRRRDRAHRRYQAALRTLATVRKLMRRNRSRSRVGLISPDSDQECRIPAARLQSMTGSQY